MPERRLGVLRLATRLHLIVAAGVLVVGLVALPSFPDGVSKKTGTSAGTTAVSTTATSVPPVRPATSCPPPTTERPAMVGGRVTVGMAINADESDLCGQLRVLYEGGVRFLRADFSWDRAEPAPGHFDWAATDRFMSAAADVGLDVLAIVDYSARWASSDPDGNGDVAYPPNDSSAYASYAAAVVSRYGPGGEFWTGRARARALAAVELWNEPWGWFFWKPEPDPAAYAGLARQAAQAVKNANPGVKVVVPADVEQSRQDDAEAPWFDAVLAAEPGLADVVDVWSVHPYPHPRSSGPVAPDDGDFGRVATTYLIAGERGATRPVWITEIGWSSAVKADGGTTEENQAAFLGAALDRVAAEWPFVDHVFVYSWDTSSGDPTDLEGNFGLRRTASTTKPAWAALMSRLA